MDFQDFTPGTELQPREVTDLRGDDMKLMAALLQDPYPPHFDRRRADKLGYPGLLNQGPANTSYMIQPILRECSAPTDIVEIDLRFRDMVFEGETVTATASVEERTVSGGDGLVEFSVALEKEDGTVAVDGTAKARFDRS